MPQGEHLRRAAVVLMLCAAVAAVAFLVLTRAPDDEPRATGPAPATQPPPATVAVPAGAVTIVADPAGDDGDPGSVQQPVRTIGKALELAQSSNLRNTPAHVQVRPGTYRETLTLGPWEGQTSAPIILEGPATGAPAVVSGSDVWDGWAPVTGTRLLTHPWTAKWGLAALPAGWDGAKMPGITRRREMVFA